MHIDYEPATKRFAAYTDENMRMGEIDYEMKDGDMVATHTLVDEAYRGHGVAGKLLDALTAHAEKEGLKIIPECPYVAAAFERNPARYAKVVKET